MLTWDHIAKAANSHDSRQRVPQSFVQQPTVAKAPASEFIFIYRAGLCLMIVLIL